MVAHLVMFMAMSMAAGLVAVSEESAAVALVALAWVVVVVLADRVQRLVRLLIHVPYPWWSPCPAGRAPSIQGRP